MKNSIKLYLIILPIVLAFISNSIVLIGLAILGVLLLSKLKAFRKLVRKSYQENCRLEKLFFSTTE